MATELSMNGRKKIETIQKEFTSKFPYLTLVFLDEKRQTIDISKSLSEVRKVKGDDVSIIASLKVNTLEKRFLDNFGIIVEVAYQKQEKLIFTKDNVNLTLNELNKWCSEHSCDKFQFSKALKGNTLTSIQDQLLQAIKGTYPLAEAKKINKDNFLDIFIPETNTNRGSHLFFNTSKGEIKVGFYCRDEEFIEKVLSNSSNIEKYSQGIRILNNPLQSDIDEAANNALSFINEIINSSQTLSSNVNSFENNVDSDESFQIDSKEDIGSKFRESYSDDEELAESVSSYLEDFSQKGKIVVLEITENDLIKATENHDLFLGELFNVIGVVDLKSWQALSKLIGKDESDWVKNEYLEEDPVSITLLYCNGNYVYAYSAPKDEENINYEDLANEQLNVFNNLDIIDEVLIDDISHKIKNEKIIPQLSYINEALKEADIEVDNHQAYFFSSDVLISDRELQGFLYVNMDGFYSNCTGEDIQFLLPWDSVNDMSILNEIEGIEIEIETDEGELTIKDKNSKGLKLLHSFYKNVWQQVVNRFKDEPAISWNEVAEMDIIVKNFATINEYIEWGTKENLGFEMNKSIIEKLSNYSPDLIVSIIAKLDSGAYESGNGSGTYEGCSFELNYSTEWSNGYLESNTDENITIADVLEVLNNKNLTSIDNTDFDLRLGELHDGYNDIQVIWADNEPDEVPDNEELYNLIDIEDSNYAWENPSSIEFHIHDIDSNRKNIIEKIIWEGIKIGSENIGVNIDLECHIAAAEGNVNELRRLIDEGADPDVVDLDGKTPLHKAVINGHIDCVNLLIKSNVNIDRCVIDEDNMFGTIDGLCSPLKYAITNMNWSIADLLINSGAKFDDIIENTASGATIFELMNWTQSDNENYDENKIIEIENIINNPKSINQNIGNLEEQGHKEKNENTNESYSLEFRAWIGEPDEIDTEDPTDFFDKEFNSIDEAKDFLPNGRDHILWNEGEWKGHFLTISFKNEPKIFDKKGECMSVFKIVDYTDNEIEWVDEKNLTKNPVIKKCQQIEFHTTIEFNIPFDLSYYETFGENLSNVSDLILKVRKIKNYIKEKYNKYKFEFWIDDNLVSGNNSEDHFEEFIEFLRNNLITTKEDYEIKNFGKYQTEKKLDLEEGDIIFEKSFVLDDQQIHIYANVSNYLWLEIEKIENQGVNIISCINDIDGNYNEFEF